MRATQHPFGPARVRAEARLLYTLLDAADSNGLFKGTFIESRWRATNARIHAGAAFESEAENLHDLLAELDAGSLLASTWMEERWRAIRSRVSAAR